MSPTVKLLAATSINYSGGQVMADLGFTSTSPKSADALSEFAGRNCYRSFDRPNPATADNEDYLKHILDVGHESVLEHASATFYVETSRSVLTELERHRHLSFSVVSQRYVNMTGQDFKMLHLPPALKDMWEDNPLLGYRMGNWADDLGNLYDEIVEYLAEEKGLPRKQAREAARAVLPNATNSPMVVTGNHRTWRYVIKARWHEAADAEIRELAGELLAELRRVAPAAYQDIPDTPYSY